MAKAIGVNGRIENSPPPRTLVGKVNKFFETLAGEVAGSVLFFALVGAIVVMGFLIPG